MEGTELLLTPADAPDPLVVWIAKLNSFEEEEANMAARVARARLINAIKEIGSPEYDYLKSQMATMLTEAMAMSIAQSRESEIFVKAMNQLRSDPDWTEKHLILDQTEEERLTGIEKEAHEKLKNEQAAALLDLHEQLMKDLRKELSELHRDEILELFEQAYLNEQGMAAFGVERSRQHIYLCMRVCQATPPTDDNGRWDHSGCDHQRRFLASDLEVNQLPQSVRDQVEQTYQSLMLSPMLARFTDALASSSASLEPSVTAAEPMPSGPAETSGAQG